MGKFPARSLPAAQMPDGKIVFQHVPHPLEE